MRPSSPVSTFILTGMALLPLSAFALVQSVATTMPKGVVACVSEKALEDYLHLAQTAPDFAKQKIDRADCYINKDAAPGVIRNKVNDYAEVELLSGHKVWIVARDLPTSGK